MICCASESFNSVLDANLPTSAQFITVAIMAITIQTSLGDSVPDVMAVINLVIQLTRISGINLFGKPIE